MKALVNVYFLALKGRCSAGSNFFALAEFDALTIFRTVYARPVAKHFAERSYVKEHLFNHR